MILRFMAVVAALLAAGCVSTPPGPVAGCGLFSVTSADSVFSPPAVGEASGSWLFDARMKYGRITEDSSGCLIEAVAPTSRVAETQIRWLRARARAVCGGRTEVHLLEPVTAVEPGYGFAMRVSSEAKCDAQVAAGDAAVGGSVDPSSRNMNPPRYPPAAVRQGLHGTVLLVVQVEPDGSVGAIRVGKSSGHRLLDEAAEDGAQRWRFNPGRSQEGQPVAAMVAIPVEFQRNW